MKKALAFDIGGTKIYSAIVDENGKFLSEISKNSTPKTTEEIISIIKGEVLKNKDNFDVVSFATAGAVNNENTAVISSTGNLPSDYRTIKFHELTDKKVFVENDANAAAWAEHKVGSTKDYAYSIMLTLGTGVGGGIILNNKLYKGRSGAAGEMHFKMSRFNTRNCTCGSNDCFEIYASGNGLKLTAQEVLKNDKYTSYDVIEGVNKNDENMIKVFNMWQKDIADGILGLQNLFDVECFSLSGSMAEFTDVKKIEDYVNKYTVTSKTKVVKASAGNNSGMIGAALLALEKYNG
ncbi:ROK family protein [bacterium]|nr:ROK family protein [bacterium]